MERKQLRIIASERNNGKLKHYWYMVLIRLEQKISAYVQIKKHDEVAKHEPSSIDGEQNESESETRTSATRASRKIPGSHDINDIVEIAATWNNMINNQEIPKIKTLDSSPIKSIKALLTKYNKEIITNTISKIPHLRHDKKYPHKMTLKRFVKGNVFNMVKSINVAEDVQVDWFQDYLNDIDESDNMNLDSIPEFTNTEEAVEWWNNNA